MKKLIALLFILVGIGAFTQEFPKNLNIPKRFENYREKTRFACENFYMRGHLMHEHPYDINGDGISDVSELHPVSGFDENGYTLITEYPLFYGFDFNGNQVYDSNEILYDSQMDGLNGNEEWLDRSENLNST